MSADLTIGFFGDGRWARRALDHIIDTSKLEVSFIIGRYPQPDPALPDYAERLGVPFLTDPDVNRPSFRDTLRDLGADVHVSMSFDQILTPESIELAPRGFINCHAGALPFYRGRNVLNWALMNGEDRLGVTVHYVDEGIDTGDIIQQQFVPIAEEDDYASLLDKAIPLCAETLHTALLQMADGRVDPTPQDDIHPIGFYCSRRREGDEWIDWTWSSTRIHNFVRALTPPAPGARTMVDGSPLIVLATDQIEEAPEYIDRPGTVVGRDSSGMIVKTGDTTLRVQQVADVGESEEITNARCPAYPIGTVFGRSPRRNAERLHRRIQELEQRIDQLAAGQYEEQT